MVLDIDKEAKEEVEVEVLCAVPPMQVRGRVLFSFTIIYQNLSEMRETLKNPLQPTAIKLLGSHVW